MIKTKEDLFLKLIDQFLNENVQLTGAGDYETSSSADFDSEEKEQELNIEDLPAMTGRTETFVFQSVPCTTAAAVAQREGDIWDGQNLYERDPAAAKHLDRYWNSVNRKRSWWRNGRGENQDHHWSAAFVSFIMQHEGTNPAWDKSARHRSYLTKAWNRRRDVNANPDSYKGQVMFLAFSGHEIIGNGRASDFGKFELAGSELLQPGDVIGNGSAKEKIHMDVFIGGERKVGGNTRGGGNRKYCPPGKKESDGFCGTSGRQAANTRKTTDVIKRVKVLGSVSSYTKSGGGKSGDPLDVLSENQKKIKRFIEANVNRKIISDLKMSRSLSEAVQMTGGFDDFSGDTRSTTKSDGSEEELEGPDSIRSENLKCPAAKPYPARIIASASDISACRSLNINSAPSISIEFMKAVLGKIGAPVTDENLKVLLAQSRIESTKAKFNPLATTHGKNNSSLGTNFNSVGVMNYKDYETGVESTAKTLMNKYYPGILADLRSAKKSAVEIVGDNAKEFNTWGTRGAKVYCALRSGKLGSSDHLASLASDTSTVSESKQDFKNLVKSFLIKESVQMTGGDASFSPEPVKKSSEKEDEDSGEIDPGFGSGKGLGIDGLHPSARAKFANFFQELKASGISYSINSAQRMPSYQQNLKRGPKKVKGLAAEPCRSDHQYGFAVDINISYKKGGKKITGTKQGPRENWLPVAKIAKKHGVYWQGNASSDAQNPDRVHFYTKTVDSATKDNCSRFYSENPGNLGTVKSKWDISDMQKLEKDHASKIKRILGISRIS